MPTKCQNVDISFEDKRFKITTIAHLSLHLPNITTQYSLTLRKYEKPHLVVTRQCFHKSLDSELFEVTVKENESVFI